MKSKWSTIPLSEIAISRGGSTNPAKFQDELFELFSIPAYDRGKPEILLGNEIGSSKKNIEPNDVIISRIVPHIQRVWVVSPKGNQRQIASGEWIIYRSNKFFPPFLRYALLTKQFHAQFMQTISGVGGSLLRVRPDQVAQIEIPLPPLAEQKRITAILDKADAIRRKRQAAIKLADDFLRATFLDMFGDPVTNPKGWRTLPLKDILERIDSGWSPQCYKREPSKGEWGVLKLGAVTTCSYLERESKALPSALSPRPELEVKKGDLLFTRKNTYDLVAACALVNSTRPKLLLSDLIFRLKIKDKTKVNPAYLWALLTHTGKRRQIQSLAGGAAGSMPNISKGRLLEQKIEVPDNDLQIKFSLLLSKTIEMKAKLFSEIEETEEIFNSLSQRAFRGEL